MSADLHIHVLEGCTEEDLSNFFACTIGTKYFDEELPDCDLVVWERVVNTPNIWVGERSYPTPAVFNDATRFGPAYVQVVEDAIGEDLPVVDDALIWKIRKAMAAVHKTPCEAASTAKVVKFLKRHRGKRVFAVLW